MLDARRRSASLRLVLLALALSALVGVADVTAEGPALTPQAAFDRLKSLEGTWVGEAGHGQPGQAATVTYRVASNGSVVQETLFPGTPHEMISMYHLADGGLAMTHYCAMANQPRMKLDAKTSTADRLVFGFDGGSGFDPAKDSHVHSGVLEWKGDALHADWAVWSGGREAAHNVFALRRKK